ncbi:MAG: hypothetical protein JNL26_06125 [Gemmatimonadetes bacterium]|nr:hypothetical protein [Gemmatimonadota bacterium]
MSTRRYGDDEVREIFSLATTGDDRDRALPAESGGLSLDELRQIAREAGIDPGRVAAAAATLDARGRAAPVRRALGLPVGLSRVVDLPREPTEREWEQLVTAFRTTFGTTLEMSSTGGLREWRNGNLHICVEPTEHGHQLRLATLKDDAIALNVLGVATGAMAVLMGAVVTLAGKPDKAMVVASMFGGIALFAFGANVIRVPRWARERDRQLQELANRAVKLLSDR